MIGIRFHMMSQRKNIQKRHAKLARKGGKKKSSEFGRLNSNPTDQIVIQAVYPSGEKSNRRNDD